MRFIPVVVLIIVVLSGFVACERSSDPPTEYRAPEGALFTALAPEASGVGFINEVTGDADFNVLTYRNFFNGAGVAIADLNNDDLPDLYFTANQGPNKLYLNQGDLQFKEVENAGGAAGTMFWSTGVTAVDVNADGKTDLYVCNSGEIDGSRRANELFINQGNDADGQPIFREMAEAYGLADNGFGTQAAWFDYDRDGDLDVYLLNNSYLDPQRIVVGDKKRDARNSSGGDKLFRNDSQPGNPQFTDVSEAAGIYGSNIGFGLGVGLGDLNNDGWTDLYISNDFWERDYLYLNQQDGTFSEDLNRRMSHVSISSMGSDVADIDNDGDLDVFSTDMLPADNYRLKANTLFNSYSADNIKFRADYHYQILQNCLQLNDGSADFTEVANYAGVAATDWSWGALVFDFENDGRKDIFVANGIYQDIMFMDFTDFISDKEEIKKIVTEKGTFDWRDFAAYLPSTPLPNYAFQQTEPLRFDNRAAELGLGKPGFSNGAAYGDLDGDGDLDLVVNNVNEAASIYQNNNSADYLKIKLTGTAGNPDAVGARVSLRTADQGTQVLENYPARGYLSSVDKQLIFGLGTDASVTKPLEITVNWPDQGVPPTVLTTRELNTVLEISPASATDSPQNQDRPAEEASLELVDLSEQLGLAGLAHQDNLFNDLDREPLLHRMLSTPGPVIVTGDPNGDGLEDFLLGGGPGQGDQLFLQQRDGTFKPDPQSMLAAGADKETSAGAFFDADGDGDEDLILGTGGNDLRPGFDAYRLRFFENTNGRLIENPLAGPSGGGEVSCILPQDIDFDGDVDLFVGCRAIPGNYGMTPRNFLLINEGGRWSTKTPPAMESLGMVTDGVWADVNDDTRPDLILVGDWLPVTIFFNLGTEISEPFQLANSAGWWNTIEAADLDGDGRQDLVVGNWGLNSKFTASAEHPLDLYLNDFDRNGKTEFIINWRPPGETRSYPFASKKELHQQMPMLRKRALKYADYAGHTYESLFTEAEREGAFKRSATELRSCVLWGEGVGKFTIQPLPAVAQLFPVFAVAAGDMTGNGFPDLWLGGNLFGMPPQSGRMDAGKGLLLANDGERNWTEIGLPPAARVEGQVRDARLIRLADGRQTLLVGVNDGPVRAFGFGGR